MSISIERLLKESTNHKAVLQVTTNQRSVFMYLVSTNEKTVLTCVKEVKELSLARWTTTSLEHEAESQS